MANIPCFQRRYSPQFLKYIKTPSHEILHIANLMTRFSHGCKRSLWHPPRPNHTSIGMCQEREGEGFWQRWSIGSFEPASNSCVGHYRSPIVGSWADLIPSWELIVVLVSLLRARPSSPPKPLAPFDPPYSPLLSDLPDLMLTLYWWGATLFFRSIIQIPRYNIRSYSMVWDIVRILCLSHVLRPWVVNIAKHF